MESGEATAETGVGGGVKMLGHQHLYTTLKHKYFLFIAARKVGKIPLWQVIVHDMSKFSPAEFWAYHYYFHVSKERGRDFVQ